MRIVPIKIDSSISSSISALLTGLAWQSQSASDKTILFSGNPPPFSRNILASLGYSKIYSLTEEQVENVKLAFNTISELIPIEFRRVDKLEQIVRNAQTHGIFLASVDYLSATGGSRFLTVPWPPQSGPITCLIIFIDRTVIDKIKSHLWHTALLHEVCHALGLKHPEPAVPSDHPPYLPQKELTAYNTIMSSKVGFCSVNGTAHKCAGKTPMAFDVRALQYLYGKNMTHQAGDTIYAFDGAGKNGQPILEAAWDSGGHNMIETNKYAGDVEVSNVPGKVSQVGYQFFQLAFGSKVEKIVTGAGNDHITATDHVTITTGEGQDTIIITPTATEVIVTDFCQGNDTIDLSQLNVDSLEALNITSNPEGTTIQLGSCHIRLLGVFKLTPWDFKDFTLDKVYEVCRLPTKSFASGFAHGFAAECADQHWKKDPYKAWKALAVNIAVTAGMIYCFAEDNTAFARQAVLPVATTLLTHAIQQASPKTTAMVKGLSCAISVAAQFSQSITQAAVSVTAGFFGGVVGKKVADTFTGWLSKKNPSDIEPTELPETRFRR
ncbi:MAG: protease [Gammaproteobacteria bacterium]|nr:protease [Gammaproteobacteria bacterium]